jgi:hypothetical protein
MKASLPVPGFAMGLLLAVLALLALQAWVEYRLLMPLGAQVQQLTQDIQTLRKTTAAVTVPVSPPQARLRDILLKLGQQPDDQTRIERLHRIAAQNAVLVRKASYQNKSKQGSVSRHEVQADLGGSYPAIRQFLRELMVQDEALALESIELSRPAGSTGIRAKVRLVLFSYP